MTRLELLRLVVGKAHSNGFEFRRWYTASLNEPWINADLSLHLLEEHRRYYSLLFSHDFAKTFWKPGSEITFAVAAQTFQRRMPDGTLATISRKSFIRRSARRDAWRFHLREMAAAEEPLRYIRRYLHVLDEPDLSVSPELSAPSVPPSATAAPGDEAAGLRTAPHSRRKPPRPLPQEPPAFLLRPYGGPSRGSSAP